MKTNLIAKKPYITPFVIWIIAGTIIPLISIAYYGFTSKDGGFTFANIIAMFRPDHMQALGLSLLLAFISTAICLIIAFPMAMILRESKYGKQGFLSGLWHGRFCWNVRASSTRLSLQSGSRDRNS